ncbi:nicotinate-nucleotide adenylyltransferase [Primorskyibacter sp. S87]|uniref:nicotinate-nucleotide adenylyltransferase n=1 Tax=Primorskyibacter sp. S87 TaxID=3415126 RepID=UPI003C7C8255
MRNGVPFARPGQRIGLFGGSFDPPHEGHVHVTRTSLKKFGLDAVWWLVSPGNPLKERGPAPLEQRLAAARSLMQHPRVKVTGIEEQLGTRATIDTLDALQARCPGVRFVWIMGADNLAQFHNWDRWRQILDSVPVGVVARPGDRISARMSPAAQIYRQFRLDGQASHMLGRAEAPAWCFVNMPMMPHSSTAIREKGTWVSSR